MPQIDNDLIPQSEYARHRGCSREAVRKAVAAGRISAFGPDQRINAALADSQWAQNTRPRARPGSSANAGPVVPAAGSGAGDGPSANIAPGVPGYEVSRARREQAEAQMAELKLQRELGRVYEVEDVRAALADAATRVRVQLEGVAATLASQLVNMADENLISAVIASRIEQVLQDMADGFAALARQGAPGTPHDGASDASA